MYLFEWFERTIKPFWTNVSNLEPKHRLDNGLNTLVRYMDCILYRLDKGTVHRTS